MIFGVQRGNVAQLGTERRTPDGRGPRPVACGHAEIRLRHCPKHGIDATARGCSLILFGVIA